MWRAGQGSASGALEYPGALVSPRRPCPAEAGPCSLALGLALALGLHGKTALAQVNVERLRVDSKKAPATATLEGNFTGRTGNVQSVVVGASAIGAAALGRHRFFGSMLADYARFGTETRVSRSFVHFRHNYFLTSVLATELFAQQQQDKFQRLLLRELVGAGPRFLVTDAENLRVAVGTAYMLEYERISVAPGAPDEPIVFAHRSSSYVSATWSPDGRVRLIGTVYVQPRFDDWGDARVLFETALTTEVVNRLGVKVLATMRHDTEPPTEVKRTDLEIRNSIVLRF